MPCPCPAERERDRNKDCEDCGHATFIDTHRPQRQQSVVSDHASYVCVRGVRGKDDAVARPTHTGTVVAHDSHPSDCRPGREGCSACAALDAAHMAEFSRKRTCPSCHITRNINKLAIVLSAVQERCCSTQIRGTNAHGSFLGRAHLAISLVRRRPRHSSVSFHVLFPESIDAMPSFA